MHISYEGTRGNKLLHANQVSCIKRIEFVLSVNEFQFHDNLVDNFFRGNVSKLRLGNTPLYALFIDENQRLIAAFVDKHPRNIYLRLLDRDKEIYEKFEFKTRSTKSGIAFIEFTHAEGASVITPSAWINIEM